MELLTIKEISLRLNMPESTVRYYRDKHPEFIPGVGEGRKKRYKPEVLNVLRFIAEGYNRNLTAEEIKEGLSAEFARNIEEETTTAVDTATTQQQPHYAFFMIAETLRLLAERDQELKELREEIQELRADFNRDIEERDKQIMEKIRAIQETQKRSWWDKLFNRKKTNDT